jgi:peptidyl-prolyl cis-trans isomerase C
MKILRYCIAFLIAGIVSGIYLADAKELAKGDDFVITDTDLKKRIMIERQQPKSIAEKEKLLNRMIDEDLILREAQKLDLLDNEDYKLRVETFKKELLMDLYLNRLLDEKNTEENQKKYYEGVKEKYAEPEMVRISVISVGSEDEAKEVLKKARDGEDFAELAKKYSKGPSVRQGGDLGYRARKTLKKEIADAAFSMKKGEISEPVKTADGGIKTEDGGYHIIKLVDLTEAGIPPFGDMKDRVAIEYGRKLVADKISDLRKAVKFQIDSKELEGVKTD